MTALKMEVELTKVLKTALKGKIGEGAWGEVAAKVEGMELAEDVVAEAAVKGDAEEADPEQQSTQTRWKTYIQSIRRSKMERRGSLPLSLWVR